MKAGSATLRLPSPGTPTVAKKLKAGQTLEWRDKIVFDAPGVYQVYLGVCYAGSVEACRTAPWDRLSPSIAVTIGPGTHWWTGLATPFNCYSRVDMEHNVVVYTSETGPMREPRVVGYPMRVSRVSANGLRFKVYDNPEMWVMAGCTLPEPT